MPCKPKMLGCKATCAHYLFVRDYQQERERQETWAEDHPEPTSPHSLITFHQWLGKGPRDGRPRG